MNINKTQTRRPWFYTTAIALAFAGMVATAPAFAAPFHGAPRGRGGDRDWHRHEVVAHRDWHRGYPAPGVVYSPPVVYEPPPPVESPGLNLIVPLNFH